MKWKDSYHPPFSNQMCSGTKMSNLEILLSCCQVKNPFFPLRPTSRSFWIWKVNGVDSEHHALSFALLTCFSKHTFLGLSPVSLPDFPSLRAGLSLCIQQPVSCVLWHLRSCAPTCVTVSWWSQETMPPKRILGWTIKWSSIALHLLM